MLNRINKIGSFLGLCDFQSVTSVLILGAAILTISIVTGLAIGPLINMTAPGIPAWQAALFVVVYFLTFGFALYQRRYWRRVTLVTLWGAAIFYTMSSVIVTAAGEAAVRPLVMLGLPIFGALLGLAIGISTKRRETELEGNETDEEIT